MKDSADIENADFFFDKLETELLSVWPMERLVSPDLVRGDASTVREAITTVGWPTLDAVRGKALFVILNGGEFGERYVGGDPSLRGRPLFVRGQSNAAHAAVLLRDNPVGNEDDIRALVEQGFIVRTRADEVGENGPHIVAERLASALESGAHFLSTDRPGELVLPKGTPSRCNPVSADSECDGEALENPSYIK